VIGKLTPERTEPYALPIALWTDVSCILANVVMALLNVLAGNWTIATIEIGTVAACGALLQGMIYAARRHQLWTKRATADVESAEHTRAMLAKQHELMNRDLVAAAAAERRH